MQLLLPSENMWLVMSQSRVECSGRCVSLQGCKAGPRATKALSILTANKYEHLLNVLGGFSAWEVHTGPNPHSNFSVPSSSGGHYESVANLYLCSSSVSIEAATSTVV